MIVRSFSLRYGKLWDGWGYYWLYYVSITELPWSSRVAYESREATDFEFEAIMLLDLTEIPRELREHLEQIGF